MIGHVQTPGIIKAINGREYRYLGQNQGLTYGDKVEFTPQGTSATGIRRLEGGAGNRGGTANAQGMQNVAQGPTPDLKEKLEKLPYGFVPVVPELAVTDTPVFHDGRNPKGEKRLSGEFRITLRTLTPFLPGNYRYQAKDVAPDRQGAVELPPEFGIDFSVDKEKAILEPLRDREGRVLIGGSALTGMLRHSLGALLSAPMERVTERSYSYRPNLSFGNRLEPRAAVVIDSPSNDGSGMRVQLVKSGIRPRFLNGTVTPGAGNHLYYGGIDGKGELAHLAGKGGTHSGAYLRNGVFESVKNVPKEVVKFYWKTLNDLANDEYGHISSRHPHVEESDQSGLKNSIKSLKKKALNKGVLIYLEWDRNTQQITSLGHNFRYRQRYTGTVRTRWNRSNNNWETRPILKPLDAEQGDKPRKLSGARLFFGYAATTDHDSGAHQIGKDDYERLAGRLAFNIAFERLPPEVEPDDDKRFLNQGKAIPLKVLGMPRPSAVEFHLDQRNANGRQLVTYGDLPGDEGGELRGRKFYRHQAEAGIDHIKADSEQAKSKQATLARFVSKPETEFRVSLRFRDLRPWELGAVLLALEPWRIKELRALPNGLSEFKGLVNKEEATSAHEPPAFAHKLGYGQPLGMGSVHIEMDAMDCWDGKSLLRVLPAEGDGTLEGPMDEVIANAMQAVGEKLKSLWNDSRGLDVLQSWFEIHKFRGTTTLDYPRKNGEIFGWHTDQRKAHARARRQEKA